MPSVRITVLAAALVFCGRGARAQQIPTASEDTPPPGRYHLGPFYLTPRLSVGPIGLDTNVFYTPTDRRTDVSGAGGPGLEITLPFRRNLQLTVGGNAGYLYFVRTESQRRLTGGLETRLDWTGVRTGLHLNAGYGRNFSRPAPDVDRRIQEDVRQAGARLKRRLFGRVSLSLSAGVARHGVDSGQEFLGTDLGATLSRDVKTAGGALEYALTGKTGLVLEGRWQRDEHRSTPARDVEHIVATAGIGTSSTVLLQGRVLLGATATRPLAATSWGMGLYADADVTWHVTRRTRLGGGYVRDSSQTAFAVVSGPATAVRETMVARAAREVHRKIDLWVTGRRTRLRTDSPVVLTLASGTVESVRDDVARELTVNLGYRFRPSFRLGLQAGYSDRQSSIADLGVNGLLLGGTVSFDP